MGELEAHSGYLVTLLLGVVNAAGSQGKGGSSLLPSCLVQPEAPPPGGQGQGAG